MLLSMIVAIARDGAIGRKGDQPFYIREDLRHFKMLTMGHPIIMGRRTFEALPKGALPGRMNIVVSRDISYQASGATVVASPQDAMDTAAASGADEAFIIGGGELYRLAMPLAARLYVTEINADVPDADTFFPKIDQEEWKIESTGDFSLDERENVPFRFVCYSRK